MKKSAKIIPVFISIIILGLLFLNNLKIEMTIPAKGWSRPIDLKTDSNYPVKMYNFEQNGETNILFPTGKDTVHISVNKKLQIDRKKIIPVSGEISSPFWFKDGQIIYLKGTECYFYDGKEVKIADGVIAFVGNNEGVLFAIEKNLYHFDSMSKNYHLITNFDFPISKILLSKSNKDVLVVQNVDDYQKKLTLIHKEKQVEIGRINLNSSEGLDDIDFDVTNNNGLIIYGTTSIVQGVRTTIPYYLPFNLDNVQKAKVTRWNIEGDFTGSPRNFNISLRNGTSVLFTAEGTTKGKISKVNVYEAKLPSSEKLDTASFGDYIVEKRSVSNTTASKPFRLNEKGSSIAWLGFDGEKYRLFAATTDSNIVKKANSSNENDYKTAAFESITYIFSAVLLLFFALIWLFPPAIIYAVLFFIQGHRFETNYSWWIVPFSFISYLGTQIYFFNTQFSKGTMIMAPAYLRIPNGLIVWPIILGVISYLVYFFTKEKDTNSVIGLSYTIGINLLFVSLLLGVYIL